MKCDDDQAAWMEGLMEAFQTDNTKCSDWQVSFFKDQIKRWDQYGQDTFFSDRQWVKIGEVAEALDYTGPEK